MQVSEVMTRSVDLVSPNMQIKDAAVRMREDNVGALPVGENDRLVGMVTDRDIAMRAVAENRSPSQTAVRDVMSEKVFYCFDDNDLMEAARLMAKHQVHRLPVLNRGKRLVGIVALADLARTSDQAAREAVRGISEPTDVPRR
jgi:CBS domain-containing protein